MRRVWLPALVVLGSAAALGCTVDADDRGFTKAPLAQPGGVLTRDERPMPVAGEPVRQVPFAATQPQQPAARPQPATQPQQGEPPQQDAQQQPQAPQPATPAP